MEIEELHKLYRKCSGVTTDSRKIEDGAMFFALKGENFDGNDFAMKALEAGARYAIVDRPTLDGANIKGRRYCIVVENVLDTLQKLAAYHRDQFDIPVVGITGTNGKTTTKELVSAVLSAKYNTVATGGNLNNHIGVPLTLLKISDKTEMAVIEMGASAPGEIAALVKIAKPTCGIVTNVGRAHLLGFGSFEGVKKTK
ncbi:MAG: UDP-N-acetylmuramoyl-tripeptide--D-alanyl-D-alanine ligase, partial [Bacteroidales bacterium]|nr:UDP-N-acetylmuramoyl-tripeptide--D-alanyl-D-alanine ligase [Bacteroidales bacterium]